MIFSQIAIRTEFRIVDTNETLLKISATTAFTMNGQQIVINGNEECEVTPVKKGTK